MCLGIQIVINKFVRRATIVGSHRETQIFICIEWQAEVSRDLQFGFICLMSECIYM